MGKVTRDQRLALRQRAQANGWSQDQFVAANKAASNQAKGVPFEYGQNPRVDRIRQASGAATPQDWEMLKMLLGYGTPAGASGSRGYSRGGGGGGGAGIDIEKAKQQIGQLRTSGRAGVEGVSNETIMRLAALQQQARDRNNQLLAQVGNPYQNALSQLNNSYQGMLDDANRWGAPTAALGSEMDARRLAMQNSQARQQSLMGQIGAQMESSLAGRQASAEQAKQNALNDLEKLYTAAMQKLGG